MDAADAFHRLGFKVSGYSNSPKKTIFPSFHGNQFEDFLADILMSLSVLSLTPKTKGLLNFELFCKLNYPTYLVNVSRGEFILKGIL